MRPQFGDDITNVSNNDPDLPVVMHCTRMAGRAIIRVVGRCNEAQENCKLDLSDCQLMQIPDAVYHLMRNTILHSCDLSSNSISKIGAKFSEKFPVITELNLGHNRISSLPDSLCELSQLRCLDLSHNALTSLPAVVLKLPALEKLSVAYNRILSVDIENVESAVSLRHIDLRENPLTDACRDALRQAFSVCTTESDGDDNQRVVMLSAPEDEDDWNV